MNKCTKANKMNAYEELVKISRKIHNLEHMSSIVGWDQQTMMPQGSNDARSNALAEFDVLLHQISTDAKAAELIKQASTQELTKIEKASLLEIKREYELHTILPDELVKAKSLAGSKCEYSWREQRENNDWKGFLVNFEEVVNLSRQEASIRAEHTGLSPYDSLLNIYEPDMNSKLLDDIFFDVKSWLPSLISEIVDKQKNESILKPTGTFSIKQQKDLGLSVMKKLGFDFDKGRLDVSAHPFCGGVCEDVRITTRYDEKDFIQSLMGIVHETGHALYEQNLPSSLSFLPVGKARSMGIHESQSLLFEMQMGRGRAFLESIRQNVVDAFGSSDVFCIDNLVKIYSEVKPGLIRVDADEVTYPAHVILRYEIEKDLMNGVIEAKDIPDMWNEKMKLYLGLDTRGNFKDGPMQDVHWTDGSFGYFPSYTLGAMYAAQQFKTVETLYPNVNENISKGDYFQVVSWLKENIWQKASLLSTTDLIKEATGESLNPKYLKQHLEQRYL